MTSQSSSAFGLPQQQQGQATGSGFVINKDGQILTNAHVVDGATKIRVTFENDKSVDARSSARDRSTDLALLKVDPKGLDLQPLRLGTASAAQVGDPVVAIGNPFGLDRTLTTGVVSAHAAPDQRPQRLPDRPTSSRPTRRSTPATPAAR